MKRVRTTLGEILKKIRIESTPNCFDIPDKATLVTEQPRKRAYTRRSRSTYRHPVLSPILEIYNQQRYKEALEFFQKRAEANPRDARSLFWMAIAQEKWGDLEGYIMSFKKAAELDPSFVDHMFQFLSRDAIITTFDDKGLERLTKSSKDAYACFWLGHKHLLNESISWHWGQEERETAEYCFQQAIELDPNLYPAYSALAFLHLQKRTDEDFDLAVSSLQNAINMDQDYVYAYVWLKACHLLGRRDEYGVEKAIRGHPKENDLVKTFYRDTKKGMLDSPEIRDVLDGLLYGFLISEFSVHDQSRLRLADSYSEQGNLAAAIAIYQRIPELDFAPALLRPIDVICEARIEAAYRKAIELNPDDSTAQCLIGDFYLEHDRSEDATQSYERALELDSKNHEAYYSLGKCYFNIGMYRTARAAFKRAAKLGNEEAKELLADPPDKLKPLLTKVWGAWKAFREQNRGSTIS